MSQYPWERSSDQPSHPYHIASLFAGFNGIDTVGKTEFADLLKDLGFEYIKVTPSLRGILDRDMPSTALMGTFMGAFASRIHATSGGPIALDPVDPIQVLARLGAEGKLEDVPSSDIVWLEKQAGVLLSECLRAGYRVISLHLTAEDQVTRARLAGRINDPKKGTPYDRFLHEDITRQIRVTDDIARQISSLEREFAGEKNVLFVKYDTSNAPGYPTNFDKKELVTFLEYIRHYFAENAIPPMVWTPHRTGDVESFTWTNDHLSQEIILSSSGLGESADAHTNWSIPVFQKDGKWCVGLSVDIFDFARSSGELRLKPWGGQSQRGDLTVRLQEKFREGSADVIAGNSQLLSDKKILTGIWHSTGTKEVSPYVTHLTPEQFRDIRSTPRYCQTVAIPIEEVFRTVHEKPGTPDKYIHHHGREYRLAAGTLDMLLLFAQQNGIIHLN